MAVDERARHALFTRLEEVLGPVPAETLLGYLPPVGWADVATKHDLCQLEERLGGRIDGLEGRIDGLEDRMEMRFGAMEELFGARLETMEHRLLSRMDQRLAAQARAMTQQTWAILGAVLVALVGAVVTTAVM
ncbi:MAG TPA: hypothetical protein VM287_13240 [Egibacteraceae bacterium]|nr:hypothetical protein [Egibacteraceae bacterium]